jgi:hypothetical protein
MWQSENGDFTPWLAKHLWLLGEKLGFDLELIATGALVDNFVVDILAKDFGSSKIIIIESQYGNNDHDHFGKMIYHFTGDGSYVCVLIAENFKEAHLKELEMLNNFVDHKTQYYAFTTDVFRINGHLLAYKLTTMVKPNAWAR